MGNRPSAPQGTTNITELAYGPIPNTNNQYVYVHYYNGCGATAPVGIALVGSPVSNGQLFAVNDLSINRICPGLNVNVSSRLPNLIVNWQLPNTIQVSVNGQTLPLAGTLIQNTTCENLPQTIVGSFANAPCPVGNVATQPVGTAGSIATTRQLSGNWWIWLIVLLLVIIILYLILVNRDKTAEVVTY